MADKVEFEKLLDVMEVADQLYGVSLQAFRKQVYELGTVLKKSMLEAGVERDVVARVLKQSFESLKDMHIYKMECIGAQTEILQRYLAPKNRGRDILGRFLTAYVFAESAPKRFLHPVDADEEQEAREKFVRGVVSRPLLRYFLVSVRGDVDMVDDFEARPMLFRIDDPSLEAKENKILKILKRYTRQYDDGSTVIDWAAAYDDPRSKELALAFISDILQRIREFGKERYLLVLDNIRQKAKLLAPAGSNQVLGRPPMAEDVEQIVLALERGRKHLLVELKKE